MKLFIILLLVILSSCQLGPDYKKPEIENIPISYKENSIEWKIVNPNDEVDRGNWWDIFHDDKLDELMQKLNKDNYNIKSALSAYNQSNYLVEKARASFLPNINLVNSSTKQFSDHKSSLTNSMSLSSSWEIDLWGNISRNVEATKATADVFKASLASARLSSQTSLAQYYYELVMVDKGQVILDKIVFSNQKIYDYYLKRYKQGVNSKQDVISAEQQLEMAKSNSESNKITRKTYENAIATLIGEIASNFTILNLDNGHYPKVKVPVFMPSTILERRPDIANAERNVALASANIGVTKSAFFPVFSLSSSNIYESSKTASLVSLPLSSWSRAINLASNITNLATYSSSMKSVEEGYNSAVYAYKNTVLSAFEDLENNLTSSNIISKQVKMLQNIRDTSRDNLNIVQNQLKAGSVDESALSGAEISFYNAEKNLNDMEGLEITTKISVIKSLGGGWK